MPGRAAPPTAVSMPVIHPTRDHRRASPASALGWAVAVAALCWPARAQAPTEAGEAAALWAPFAAEHCLKCHGAKRPKGGLVLEGREPTFDAEGLRLWTHVFERLEAGEMPPGARRVPPRAELDAVLESLAPRLRTADIARRHTTRRLNRVEYDNTIRDLLAVDVPLEELLPADAVAHGFDTVSSALGISTEQMVAYLGAAERALDAAIVPAPVPAPPPDRSVFLEHSSKQVSADAGRVGRFDLVEEARLEQGKILLELDDAVVVFNSGGYVPTEFPFYAPRAGDYRIRIRARSYQSDEPLVMSVRTMNWKSIRKGLVGYFEVGKEPSTFEAVYRLLPNDKVKVVPWRLGTRPIPNPKAYSGPGVAIMSLEVEGPLTEAWPPRSQRLLFGDLDFATATLADAREALWRFVPRAFRRPVEADDVEPFVALVETVLRSGGSFEEGIRVGLQAVLCSPEFLFVGDPDRRPGERLSDGELAVRLSYFLWSSMPDEALFADVPTGRLRDPAVLAAHVERMLADEKARAFTANFVGQWLRLREIDLTSPDKDLYPEFDELLQLSMVEETEAFFQELLDHDLSLLNFIDSDFAMLNGRLADHYGISGVEGLGIRKVALPKGSHRGGVLTHASVLKLTANGTHTSPVLRGVWVLENILGKPSPPPPLGVAAIEPDTRGTTTIREQLARHRVSPSCNTCHQRIDPPGFALESFDPIGGWREHYRSMGGGEPVDLVVEFKPVGYKRGPLVDATGTTPEGEEFGDIDEFKALLLKDSEQIARALAEKMWIYGQGRAPGFADREAIREIVERARAANFGLRTLVHEVVKQLQS